MIKLKLIYILISFSLIIGCSLIDSKCEKCNGLGKVNCSHCYGLGKTICYQCNGEGDNKQCNYCYGQGGSSCTSCNGAGIITGYVGGADGFRNVTYKGYSGYTQVSGGSINVHCSDCFGSGKKKCTNTSCKNGKDQCSNYSCENGKVKCSYIGCLNGKIECTECKGKGKN